MANQVTITTAIHAIPRTIGTTEIPETIEKSESVVQKIVETIDEIAMIGVMNPQGGLKGERETVVGTISPTGKIVTVIATETIVIEIVIATADSLHIRPATLDLDLLATRNHRVTAARVIALPANSRALLSQEQPKSVKI